MKLYDDFDTTIDTLFSKIDASVSLGDGRQHLKASQLWRYRFGERLRGVEHDHMQDCPRCQHLVNRVSTEVADAAALHHDLLQDRIHPLQSPPVPQMGSVGDHFSVDEAEDSRLATDDCWGLLAKCKDDHDPYIFADFVEGIELDLLRYIHRRIGNVETARDICQETLLTIWVNLGRYDKDKPARPWVYAIADRKTIDVWRKQQRDKSIPNSETVASVPDNKPSVETLASDREEWQTIFERLNLEERHLLSLKYAERFSCAEIARALHKDVSQVYRELHRLRKKLRS